MTCEHINGLVPSRYVGTVAPCDCLAQNVLVSFSGPSPFPTSPDLPEVSPEPAATGSPLTAAPSSSPAYRTSPAPRNAFLRAHCHSSCTVLRLTQPSGVSLVLAKKLLLVWIQPSHSCLPASVVPPEAPGATGRRCDCTEHRGLVSFPSAPQ